MTEEQLFAEEKADEYVNNIKFTFETELVQRIVKMFAKYAFLAGLHEGQKSKIIPCDRDNEHKWFAYKKLFETKWHIDYSVGGGLPKCNTIKWFENKEAVMYYLVTNGMSYCEEAKGN